MKVKFGALIVDGRGKIGGHVASKNRAGSYFRTKVTPVNRQTPAQIAVQARLASISQAWRSLTPAQRAAWDAAVGQWSKTDIFGDSRNPSGFNLHCRVNANLINLGETALTAPAAPVGVSIFETFSLAAVASGGTLVATVAPATLPAGEQLIVRATAPQSAGKSFVKSEYRQISVLDAVSAGSIDLKAAYDLKFGSVGAAGGKIFVQILHVNEDTGEVSQAETVLAIVS